MPRLSLSQQLEILSPYGIPPLEPLSLSTMQINLGRKCNQACVHCHVEASPARTEIMELATAERCLELMASLPTLKVLDLTGGAPELKSQFRRLVQGGSIRSLWPKSMRLIIQNIYL